MLFCPLFYSRQTLSLAAVTPTNVILDADKRYFCVREQITPTNVIFDLCTLAAARPSEPLAEHKTHMTKTPINVILGAKFSAGQILRSYKENKDKNDNNSEQVVVVCFSVCEREF
jgi:hypothetical protein